MRQFLWISVSFDIGSTLGGYSCRNIRWGLCWPDLPVDDCVFGRTERQLTTDGGANGEHVALSGHASSCKQALLGSSGHTLDTERSWS